MADALEPLLPVDQLFDARGTVDQEGGAPVWMPHHQGDVFSGVSMPGVDSSDENYAMLFMHPCTMRNGVVLKPNVTVIRVRQHSARKRLLDQPADWADNFKVMPLPDMLGNGTDTFFADFMSIATVNSKMLDRANRVARFSLPGRAQFQQRIIYHMTRFAPSVDVLESATAAVEEELALQEDWVGASMRAAGDGRGDVDSSEAAFDAYMSSATEISPLTRADNELLESSSRRELMDSKYQRRVSAEVRTYIARTFP